MNDEVPLRKDLQNGVDFFFKMRDSYSIKGQYLEYRLLKTGLSRKEIAGKLVADSENDLKTIESALRYIRGMIQETAKYDENISNSVKKIVEKL